MWPDVIWVTESNEHNFRVNFPFSKGMGYIATTTFRFSWREPWFHVRTIFNRAWCSGCLFAPCFAAFDCNLGNTADLNFRRFCFIATLWSKFCRFYLPNQSLHFRSWHENFIMFLHLIPLTCPDEICRSSRHLVSWQIFPSLAWPPACPQILFPLLAMFFMGQILTIQDIP